VPKPIFAPSHHPAEPPMNAANQPINPRTASSPSAFRGLVENS
jgi:hypothetical protein